MAIKLRLARYGQKKRPFYRIVAANSESRRDGRFLDIVGTFNPMVDPGAVTLKEELVKKWIEVGAKPTRTVQSLLRKHMPGVYEAKADAQRAKIQERRKKRAERSAGKSEQKEKKQKRGRKTLLKKKDAA